MHTLRRLTRAVAVGVLLLGTLAAPVAAKPEPGKSPRGFRLFARSLGALTTNRIYCGLASEGNICTDSTNSSTIGGGFWPKGTADQYVFNSGLQIAGIIQGAKATNPWAGDTSGAFFFNARGGGNGTEVQPIYNSTNRSDADSWPDAARVPSTSLNHSAVGAPVQFNALLRGRTQASQGDVWWLTWDGSPDQNASRKHPLGILVEQRGLAWNFPSGNEDIIYFVYTFYNVTSANAADYAEARPEIRPILIQKAQEFQTRNNAKFGITLPQAGYTIGPLFAAFGADMDVADAGANYSSVNLPFALGYAYEHTFTQPSDWSFDPKIFNKPGLFAGVGFVGVKYLASPTGPGAIQLFSNTTNGGAFPDPNSAQQLYRYLSAQLIPSDGNCNQGPASTTHVCFIGTSPADVRFFQSSTALTLAPGQFGSIVVAYIFAAPTQVASYTPSGAGDVKPGEPEFLTDAVRLKTLGANTVDSLTGFKSFNDDNGDGVPQQSEFTTVPGSLLGKAKIAQAVFDQRFLLPFAPDAPNFFLVPGNNQVTVIWQPSASEATGDPFFAVASQPVITRKVPDLTTPDPTDSVIVTEPNQLYDPNYRQFDVEGYRIYRGRVDSPNSLQLVAQFDYAGTSMRDFAGQVNPTVGCAPELGIIDDCPDSFDKPFPAPGTLSQARTKFVDVPLVGQLTQVQLGGRSALRGTVTDTVPDPNGTIIISIDSVLPAPGTPTAPDTTWGSLKFRSGTALATQVDTALTGGASGFPKLSDTGVPFVYIDKNVRNNFRYFYAVTAFDINSFQSGPSNLESPRNTKAVTPVPGATNVVSTGTLASHVVGRGVAMDTIIKAVPTIDASGRFSGPMPPADGGVLGFVGELVSQVVGSSGTLKAKLDSMQLGQLASSCCGGTGSDVPSVYFFSVTNGTDNFKFAIPVQQEEQPGSYAANSFFNALKIDNAMAKRFGGDSSFALKGQLTQTLPASGYTGDWGIGCFIINLKGCKSTAATYNGIRWFDGPSGAGAGAKNEVAADPTAGNCGTGAAAGCTVTNFSNGGKLTGVTNVYVPLAYMNVDRRWRNVEFALAGAYRAADFNVYWGATAGGVATIDSVIDVTHNVPVPFDSTMRASWGILDIRNQNIAGTTDADVAVTRASDFSCVEPFLTKLDGVQAQFPSTCATPIKLSNTVQLGAVAPIFGNHATERPAQANPGFYMYVAGTITMFEMPTLPAKGTVWALRTYSGAIAGGNGAAGDQGAYKFAGALRPFTAVGAELQVQFSVTNQVLAAADSNLSRVHTVPDPYYVTNEFESTTDTKIIRFVNLPKQAIIRIYSSSGVLVNLIEHNSSTDGGSASWNIRNRNNQVVASGVYFFHVESGDARKVGRFTVVNFAQ